MLFNKKIPCRIIPHDVENIVDHTDQRLMHISFQNQNNALSLEKWDYV
jgi:hypothetical protein